MNNLKKFQTFNEIIEQQHEDLGTVKTVKTFLSHKGCAKIIRKVAAKKKLLLPKKQSYAPTDAYANYSSSQLGHGVPPAFVDLLIPDF